MNTFYSIYFILLGIIQCVPNIGTSDPLFTFLPLILVVGFSYLQQVNDLFRTQRSLAKNEKVEHVVIRNHSRDSLASRKILPGDLIFIPQEDSSEVKIPCDCLLAKTTAISIFIDTSLLDGEIDVKDRFPINFPPNMSFEDFSQFNATIYAQKPHISVRSGSALQGYIDFGGNQYQFDEKNFVERGSIIRTPGPHFFIALYTGKDCLTNSTNLQTVTRKTMIDVYLEKISILNFFVQCLVSIIFASIGYNIKDYSYHIPISVSGWKKFFVLLCRNFCLLAFMIPITLKLVLPVFRFIYGMFISYDYNFEDVSGIKAEALGTNVTENLGCIDVIVSDKTGTLTKNQLEFISLTCGENKYGNNKKAPTILEDKDLHKALQLQEDQYLIQLFRAISVCHSVKVKTNFKGEENIYGSSQDELAIITKLLKLGWKFSYPQQNHIIFQSPIGNYHFEVLKVIPFNRERMRMTVVVKDCDLGGVYVYMKGAAEIITRDCHFHSGNCASEFLQYQKQGFRAFGVSFKRLEGDFNKAEDLPNEQLLEDGHKLLGCLGIEDALQQDVALTLKVLTGAGLKLWIATGDAMQNTLVTAIMCKLISNQYAVLDLLTNHLREKAKFYDFIQKALQAPDDSFAVMVQAEDTPYLQAALENADFVKALFKAHCVIFYRCKPLTKGNIVLSLQNNGKRVLAVGDGSNDTDLLKAADVGVGIFGSTGTKSFQSSDFVIPSFKSLSRLILIHGHLSLHRSVLSVHFSFYKAALFAFAQITYQFWINFSGQSFFDSFSIGTYNIIWTLIPMLSVLFDKDISENFLYKLSYLYKKLRNPLSLAPSNLTWLYVGIYQGIIVMMVAWQLTGESFNVGIGSGKDFGESYLSILVYFALVCISSFYMIMQLGILTYYSLILIVGNIILLIAVSAVLQSGGIYNLGDDWIGFFGDCLNNYKVLLLLLTMILAAVSPSWLGLTVYNEIAASDTLLVIEQETLAAKEDRPLFFDPPRRE